MHRTAIVRLARVITAARRTSAFNVVVPRRIVTRARSIVPQRGIHTSTQPSSVADADADLAAARRELEAKRSNLESAKAELAAAKANLAIVDAMLRRVDFEDIGAKLARGAGWEVLVLRLYVCGGLLAGCAFTLAIIWFMNK